MSYWLVTRHNRTNSSCLVYQYLNRCPHPISSLVQSALWLTFYIHCIVHRANLFGWESRDLQTLGICKWPYRGKAWVGAKHLFLPSPLFRFLSGDVLIFIVVVFDGSFLPFLPEFLVSLDLHESNRMVCLRWLMYPECKKSQEAWIESEQLFTWVLKLLYR